MQIGASPNAAEHEKVHEVHAAENEEHATDARAELFENARHRRRVSTPLHREADVSDVDQVETDHEQVVDGSGKGLLSAEGFDQEDLPVLVKRARHPNGQ